MLKFILVLAITPLIPIVWYLGIMGNTWAEMITLMDLDEWFGSKEAGTNE